MEKRIVFYDAYLNESGIKGGSCYSLFNLIKGLRAKSEHEIILISNTTNNPLIAKYRELGISIISNKYLNRLMIYGRSSGMLRKLLVYSLNSILANLWFFRFLKGVKPDALVFNDPRGSTSFFPTSFFVKSNVRIISIIRGTREAKSSFNRISYTMSQSIITVSQTVMNSLPGKLQKKATVIHNGIESRSQSPKPVGDGFIRILSIANIAEYKGLDLVIKAISAFSDNVQKQLIYSVVGSVKEASYFEGLEKLYLSLNCKFQVKYEGLQQDVYPFLVHSDIFILPSREEGFGLVLLEAMDCSLPLIGSSVGGIPEIITDGFNGYIFEKNNPLHLKDKLERLIEEPSLRKEFGKNSKIRLKQFSIDQTVQKYLDIL